MAHASDDRDRDGGVGTPGRQYKFDMMDMVKVKSDKGKGTPSDLALRRAGMVKMRLYGDSYVRNQAMGKEGYPREEDESLVRSAGTSA